jgi:starvation-inducible DNA-binding protein
MDAEIGIAPDAMGDLADELARCLADTFVVYTKTLAFHWNVQGPFFQQLHAMFQGQYEALAESIDAIAERIRALDDMAPCSMRDLLEMASIPEQEGVPDAMTMVRILKEDHESICRNLREVIKVAQEAGDEGTANFLTDLLEGHEKTAWMLRSTAS